MKNWQWQKNEVKLDSFQRLLRKVVEFITQQKFQMPLFIKRNNVDKMKTFQTNPKMQCKYENNMVFK